MRITQADIEFALDNARAQITAQHNANIARESPGAPISAPQFGRWEVDSESENGALYFTLWYRPDPLRPFYAHRRRMI